jgi:hypothetical protein
MGTTTEGDQPAATAPNTVESSWPNGGGGKGGKGGGRGRCAVELRIPDSPARRSWDLVICLLALFSLVFFPFVAAFAHTRAAFPLSMLLLGWGVDVVFAVDIALCMRTFFYQYSGDLCMEPRRIRRHYLAKWLTTDILGTLAWPVEMALLVMQHTSASPHPMSGESSAFRCAQLLRLCRLAKIIRFESTHYIYVPLYRVAQLFGTFCTAVHITACLLHMCFGGFPPVAPGSGAVLGDIGADAAKLSSEIGGDEGDEWFAACAAQRSAVQGGVFPRGTSECYIEAVYLALLMIVGEDSRPLTPTRQVGRVRR